jgi:1,4-dihydroxy-2-naphthoate octaprenyltransferase
MQSEEKNLESIDTANAESPSNGKLKTPASSRIVTADSVQAEEVPTIPLSSLQAVSALQPEVAVRSVASTKSIQLPTPLVVQPTEYRRSLSEWQQVWWEGVRPAYAVMALAPVLLGSVLAWASTVTAQAAFGHFHVLRFLATLIAVMALQIGANLVNDYYDYIKGVDVSNTLGPGGLIQQGLIKPMNVLVLGLFLLGVGAFLGILIATTGGLLIFGLGLIGLICAYFFSATAYSLSSLSLGVVITFVVYGPLLTLGAYLVQVGTPTHSLLVRLLLYSLPLGLLAAAVVHVNDMRDVESDVPAGKRTLASFLSLLWNRIFYVLLVLGAYAVIIALGLPHHSPHLILITLWTLPNLVVAFSGILRTDLAPGLHVVMRETIKLQAFFAILLIVALFVSALVPVVPHIPTHLIP